MMFKINKVKFIIYLLILRKLLLMEVFIFIVVGIF